MLGTIEASTDTIDDLLSASLAHVHRSRSEPGCIEHGVHRDAEDLNRLVFVERWADREALDAHFARMGSGEFIEALRSLELGRQTLSIYAARAEK